MDNKDHMWYLIRIYSKWGDFIDFHGAHSCPLLNVSVLRLSLPRCPLCPGLLQDFAALGHCGPIPLCLWIGAAGGNPMDQFSPTNLSKGQKAFDGPGFPVVKVHESVAPSGAQEGAGAGSPFFSCPQQPQEQRHWAERCLLPAGQPAPLGCAGPATGCGETRKESFFLQRWRWRGLELPTPPARVALNPFDVDPET